MLNISFNGQGGSHHGASRVPSTKTSQHLTLEPLQALYTGAAAVTHWFLLVHVRTQSQPGMCRQVPSHGPELPLGGGKGPSNAKLSGSNCCHDPFESLSNFLFQCDGPVSPQRVTSGWLGSLNRGTEMSAGCFP